MLESEAHSAHLQQHMYKLYRDGTICDLEIVTRDGVTFRAHKLVLTASSRYLYSMCLQLTSEASFLFDIHSEVMHALLEFSYTGQLYVDADRWTNIQEAAELLQMYSVLELMNGQTDKGTSTYYLSAMNQSAVSQNQSVVSQNQSMVTQNQSVVSQNQSVVTQNQLVVSQNQSVVSQNQSVVTDPDKDSQSDFKEQLDHGLEETLDDTREVIIKEEIAVQDNVGKQEQSTICQGKKVKDTCMVTRSSLRSCKSLNSTPNGTEKSAEFHPNNSYRQRSRTKSEPFTEVRGQKYSAKVKDTDTRDKHVTIKKQKIMIDDLHSEPKRRKISNSDPDYDPVTKSRSKAKGKTQKGRRRKTKVNASTSAGESMLDNQSEGRNSRSINNSKVNNKNGSYIKKHAVFSHFDKICVPRSWNRVCNQCNKVFTSSVGLHVHQLYKHFSKNCSQLRNNYLVKLAKRKSDVRTCLFQQERQTSKFKCNLCHRKFLKYCHFTLHQRKKHKGSLKPVESWLRYCSVKLAMQKLLVPFAKDRKFDYTNSAKLKTQTCAKKQDTKEPLFQCADCNKTFSTRYTLATHRKNIHGEVMGVDITPREKTLPSEPLFVCVDCRKSQSSIRALCTHLQMKHDYTSQEANRLQHCLPDSMTCEECEFKTQSLQTMKDHVMKAHPSIRYQCTDCPMTFKVQLMMKRHRYTCHVQGKFNFPCQRCQKSFRKGSMLRKHEYFKHGIQHENIKVFHCEHEGCTYKTYASTAIKLHQSKHVTEKLFPCEYCGQKLKTEKIREKHIAKMHLGIRPFLCQVCGLSFGEKHELQSHITNRHSSEKSFQCQYCSYTTAVKGTFFTHLFNVHKVRAEDDKRELLKCPHCPFTSILKYRYQTHVNGHTNTRNYECKICNKSFVSANTLRSHNQWVHSDKVYSCTQCDYQTKTTQKLNEHIRVQHQLQGVKPYKCPYCSFRCATGGNTRKHVKQVHKDEVVTYIRDDSLLTAARMARASGHYASLFNTLSEVQLSHEVSEDERSELSENILHIAL